MPRDSELMANSHPSSPPWTRWHVAAGVGMPLLALLTVASRWPAWVLQAGGMIQLVGLGIVAWGLWSTRNRLRNTTTLQELRRLASLLVRPLRRWWKPGRVEQIVGRSPGRSADAATVSTEPPTLEQRVQQLDDALGRVNEEVEEVWDQLHHESAQRTEADRKLQRLVGDLASAGLRVEAVGLTWLASGLFAGVFPDVVVRLAGWLTSIPAGLLAACAG